MIISPLTLAQAVGRNSAMSRKFSWNICGGFGHLAGGAGPLADNLDANLNHLLLHAPSANGFGVASALAMRSIFAPN